MASQPESPLGGFAPPDEAIPFCPEFALSSLICEIFASTTFHTITGFIMQELKKTEYIIFKSHSPQKKKYKNNFSCFDAFLYCLCPSWQTVMFTLEKAKDKKLE